MIVRAAMAAVLGLAAAGWACAGEAAAGPERPFAVVRIEKVFENYNYFKDRNDQIQKELSPRLDQLRQKETQLQALQTEIEGLVRELGDRNNPRVQRKTLEHQAIVLDLQAMQKDMEERHRSLTVNMIADTYKFFNAACRQTGEKYKFGVIFTALDDKFPEKILTNPNITPLAIMNEIMMRNVQYLNPNVDLTNYVVEILNYYYEEYKKAPTTRPVFPLN